MTPRPTRRPSPLFVLALGCVASAFASVATPAHADAPAWAEAERDTLRHHVRLTSPDKFVKAGEAYFGPYSRWIIFQAIPVPPEGEEPSEHYSMYVAKVARDESGRVTGIEEPILISVPGSANTCGFFNPRVPYEVIFATTNAPPANDKPAGFQRDSGRYVWPFHNDMNVHRRVVPEIFNDFLPGIETETPDTPDTKRPYPLWEQDGYTAECAFSPDGVFIVYSNRDNGSNDADIHIYSVRKRAHIKIVDAPGYDGGPFFSPDGRRIVYRSDRNGDGKLQVFVGVLEFDAEGYPSGLMQERPVTNNEHVNWAPFWHPSGAYLAYTTSEFGHHRYEVFTIQAPVDDNARKTPEELPRKRITNSEGFDGLPAFNHDGSLLMWTSQRRHADDDPSAPPSSQIWVAEVVDTRP